MTEIVLKSKKHRSLERYHPWVFNGAVKKIDGEVGPGSLVKVVSNNGKFLGKGFYQEGSIAVRIITFKDEPIDKDLWRERVRKAVSLRNSIGLPSPGHTNVYRSIFAESDGLPGIILDIYGELGVLQCNTPAAYQDRSLLLEVFEELLPDMVRAYLDKSSNKLGKQDPSIQDEWLKGETGSPVKVQENGHHFLVDPWGGQKTGFFIDQRENRRLVGEYAKERRVLNAYGYTGGFSVYCAKNGAKEVITLDSSEKALELAEENISLNDLPPDSHSVIKGDVTEFLKEMDKNEFDMIILDPPGFAKDQRSKHKAVQGYKRINRMAMEKIASGGILATFSCSGVVDRELFMNTVTSAAIQVGRRMRVLHVLGQPPDHPVNIYHPEGAYLKGMIIQIDDDGDV